MSKNKVISELDEKINLIITQNDELKKIITTQQTTINKLNNDNKIIMNNVLKMGKHIDFINTTYEKINNSYFFKNIFN
jgi:hypothetical protein